MRTEIKDGNDMRMPDESKEAAVEKEKLQKKAESTPLIGNENEKSVYEWKLSDREKEIIERLS